MFLFSSGVCHVSSFFLSFVSFFFRFPVAAGPFGFCLRFCCSFFFFSACSFLGWFFFCWVLSFGVRPACPVLVFLFQPSFAGLFCFRCQVSRFPSVSLSSACRLRFRSFCLSCLACFCSFGFLALCFCRCSRRCPLFCFSSWRFSFSVALCRWRLFLAFGFRFFSSGSCSWVFVFCSGCFSGFFFLVSKGFKC